MNRFASNRSSERLRIEVTDRPNVSTRKSPSSTLDQIVARLAAIQVSQSALLAQVNDGFDDVRTTGKELKQLLLQLQKEFQTLHDNSVNSFACQLIKNHSGNNLVFPHQQGRVDNSDLKRSLGKLPAPLEGSDSSVNTFKRSSSPGRLQETILQPEPIGRPTWKKAMDEPADLPLVDFQRLKLDRPSGVARNQVTLHGNSAHSLDSASSSACTNKDPRLCSQEKRHSGERAPTVSGPLVVASGSRATSASHFAATGQLLGNFNTLLAKENVTPHYDAGEHTESNAPYAMKATSSSGRPSSASGSGDAARCVFFPDSHTRAYWDVASFIVLVFDCITIPLDMAWQPDSTPFLETTTFCTLIFWTLDMIMSFNTAFYVNGEIEARRTRVALHYIRTSFLFDIIATGSDWITVSSFLDTKHSASSFIRFIKVQRLLRIVRFLRVSSFWGRLEQMHTMFLSDVWQILSQCLMMLFGTVIVFHLSSCIWFALGARSSSDTGITWLGIVDRDGGKPYSDFSAVYQYVSAYHWAVVQMFVGSVQINATNTRERIFNILVNVFGTFFSAVITSWLAALLIQHQQHTMDFELQMKKIRRYLRNHKVNPVLASRIVRQLHLRLSEQKPISEIDIPQMARLTKDLRADLRFELLGKVVLKSQMFFLWGAMEGNLLRRLTLLIEYSVYQTGQELFIPGMHCDCAYVVTGGEFIYVLEYRASMYPTEPESEFARLGSVEWLGLKTQKTPPQEGSPHNDEDSHLDGWVGTARCPVDFWLCDAALWTGWTTHGCAESVTNSEVIRISTAMLNETLLVCGQRVRRLMDSYRKAYDELTKKVPEELLTDLSAPVDHDMVVMNMDLSARLVAAQPVLQTLKATRKQWMGDLWGQDTLKGVADIEAEVRQGECCVVFDAQGHPARVALIVVLRAERDDGLLLIQLGKVKDGQPSAKIQMPATKMHEGEEPREAAMRLLQKNLSIVGDAKNLGKCEQEVLVRQAQTYGLQTRFLRSTFHVNFRPKNVLPPMVNCGTDPVAGARYRRRSLMGSSKTLELKNVLGRGFGKDIDENLQLPDEVFFARSKGDNGTIYAWMSMATFQQLDSKDGERMGADWVSSMTIPEVPSTVVE